MKHHTKDKGDIGVGQVIAGLLSAGIQVAIPISEHLPFDLIAISNCGAMCKLSVKYRHAVNNAVPLAFRSSWSDGNGAHTKRHDMTSYDATAVYCPEARAVFYVRNDEVDSQTMTLRLSAPKNGQSSRVRYAKQFQDPNRLFKHL